MFRERVYVCPVDLADINVEPVDRQQFLLRALATDGVRRISFARRGGSRDPLKPAPDEAMMVHASGGMFGRPAEERWGADTSRGHGRVVVYEEDDE